MPVNYSCDICGKEIDHHLDAIIISGSKNLHVVCKDCWEPIEEQITTKTHEERISTLEKFP